MDPRVLDSDIQERLDELRRNIDRIAAKQAELDRALAEFDARIADLRLQIQTTKDKEQRKPLLDRLNNLVKTYNSTLRLYNELEASRIEYEKMITVLTTNKHHYMIQYKKLQKSDGSIELLTLLSQSSENAPIDVDLDDNFNVEAVA